MYGCENELGNFKQCRILITSVAEIIGLEIGEYIKILLPPQKKRVRQEVVSIVASV